MLTGFYFYGISFYIDRSNTLELDRETTTDTAGRKSSAGRRYSERANTGTGV